MTMRAWTIATVLGSLMLLSTSLAAAVPVDLPLLVPAEEAQLDTDDAGIDEIHRAMSDHVSIDGDTALVGAPQGSPPGVLVYERDPVDGWQQVDRLDRLDSAGWFGWSVDLDGDTAAVGAVRAIHDGGQTGMAYIYERGIDGTWSLQDRLVPDETSGLNGYGSAIDLDGERVVVGAASAHLDGKRAGAAFVFANQDGTWSQEARLDPGGLGSWDRFGRTVTLESQPTGATAVVTSGGEHAVRVFETGPVGGWNLAQTLVPSNAGYAARDTEIDGDLLAIGDPHPSEEVFVYERGPDGVWSQQATLEGPHASTFGASVSLDGVGTEDVGADGVSLVVGAPGAGQNEGAVHPYTRVAGEWLVQDPVQPANAEDGGSFGAAVDLDGHRAVASAPGTGTVHTLAGPSVTSAY